MNKFINVYHPLLCISHLLSFENYQSLKEKVSPFLGGGMSLNFQNYVNLGRVESFYTPQHSHSQWGTDTRDWMLMGWASLEHIGENKNETMSQTQQKASTDILCSLASLHVPQNVHMYMQTYHTHVYHKQKGLKKANKNQRAISKGAHVLKNQMKRSECSE